MTPRPQDPLDIDAYVHGISRARLGVWDWDLVSGECRYSDSWFWMLGYAPGELDQSSDLWLQMTHPDDRAAAIESGERHLRGETAEIETELRLLCKDGTWLWVLDRGGIVARDDDGRPTRMIGVQADITKQKTIERELHQTGERFRLAMEASDVGIWEFDLGSGVSFWDARTRSIFGLAPDASAETPRSWNEYLHPEDRERAEQEHDDVGPETSVIHYRIVRKDGQVRHVETFARLVVSPASGSRLTGTIRDVTEDVERKAALKWAAERDGLTGLYNRVDFERRVERNLGNSQSMLTAVIYVDLDHFKAINDRGSHAAGDAALRQVAEVLRWTADTGDAGRLGGDEFALVLQMSAEAVVTKAVHILNAVRALRIDGGPANLTVSIGVAFARPGQAASDLIAQADAACYAAKRQGRDGFVVDDSANGGRSYSGARA